MYDYVLRWRGRGIIAIESDIVTQVGGFSLGFHEAAQGEIAKAFFMSPIKDCIRQCVVCVSYSSYSSYSSYPPEH